MSKRPPPKKDWVVANTANGQWQIRREFATEGFLRRLEAPHLLLEPPAVSLRPGAPARGTTVVRVEVPELPTTPLAVKFYPNPRGVLRAVKEWLGLGRALRGFCRAALLEDNGITTASAIASGAVKGRNKRVGSYFISKLVTDSKPLRHYRRVDVEPKRSLTLMGELGRMMGRLHELCFVHTDPSLSNFLVRITPGTAPELVLVDVDGVRPVRSVSTRTALKDFRRLLYRIPMDTNERGRFVTEYCAVRRWDVRELLKEVNALVAGGAQARGGAEALATSVNSLRWRPGAKTDRRHVQHVLERPDEYLAKEALHFKNSRVVTVVRVPRLAPDGLDLVLRRLNYGKFAHRLRDFLRPSRAVRAMQQGMALDAIGVRTPRAFAAAELRRCRWPIHAYLVTEQIPGAITLQRYLLNEGKLPRQLINELATLLARLHDSGFSHRDLKLTNVLLDDRLLPWLIDLDGLRGPRRVSTQRAQADLLRLARGFLRYPALLRYSGWRFLKSYGAKRQLGSEMPAWRELLRRDLSLRAE